MSTTPIDIVTEGTNNELPASVNALPRNSIPPENESNLDFSGPSQSFASNVTNPETDQHTLDHLETVSDPAVYANKKLTPQQINLALRMENQQIDEHLCTITNGRKFLPSWKMSRLPDGTLKERKWLAYSKSKDAAFCVYCMLFASPRNQTVWSTAGYTGWIEKNASRDIELHEQSKRHLESQVSRIQWLAENRIDSRIMVQNNELVKHHREVLKVIIDCCKYLSEEMLALKKKNCICDGKINETISTFGET